MKRIAAISLIAGLIIGCSVSKKNDVQPMYKNVSFEFNNCCLATTISGSGSVDVYEKFLIVTIEQGTIRINPEFDREQYSVGDLSLSLGRFVDERRWYTFNETESKLTLNQTIKSLSDSINISGNSFRIPYTSPVDLKDSWIVITITDQTRRKYNYAHSQDKTQHFEK